MKTISLLSHHLKSPKLILLLLTVCTISNCSSYKKYKHITEDLEIPSKVYNTEFTQTWQAILQVMKKYELEHQNQESGVIKTRWITNTVELNFSDSFGSNDAIKAARFKIVLNAVKGFRGAREVTKVTIFKRQMIEQDFLQGWRVVPTDGTLETTILYRIGRILMIDNRLKKIEQEKSKAAEESF